MSRLRHGGTDKRLPGMLRRWLSPGTPQRNGFFPVAAGNAGRPGATCGHIDGSLASRRFFSSLALVLLVAGCARTANTPSASLPDPTATKTPAVRSSTTQEPAAAAPVDASRLAGTQLAGNVAPRATAPPCSASAVRLTVEVQRGDQSIGQAVRRLVLRNDGLAACTVSGYPAVSLLDAAFRPMPSGSHRTGAEVASVLLRRGQSAETLIAASEMPGESGNCQAASVYVGVRLDGWTRTLTARGEVPRCGSDVRVNPLRGR